MKIFIGIIYAMATLLLIFNVTQLEFSDILGEENMVTLIAIVACLCVIVLLTILLISKKIERLKKGK
ncbi:MAG TPA: hypothetical protein VKZ42_06050 [Flavobacteriaceae bacterium]|jgi:hypothetical protein|nr:hypothetical protein [Flavobacteriaceae bacterium]